MLANVQQATIRPVIEGSVAKGALVHTDEYDVYARLEEWGYGHKTVCHACPGRVRARRGRRRVLRGLRQHGGRSLAAAALLARADCITVRR